MKEGRRLNDRWAPKFVRVFRDPCEIVRTFPSGSLDLPNQAKPGAPGLRPPPAADDVWFEQAEASPRYGLRFHTKGRGPRHTLVPLNQIMDERYSVYLRRIDA